MYIYTHTVAPEKKVTRFHFIKTEFHFHLKQKQKSKKQKRKQTEQKGKTKTETEQVIIIKPQMETRYYYSVSLYPLSLFEFICSVETESINGNRAYITANV